MEIEPGYMVSPSVRLEKNLGAARLGWLWSAQELTLDTAVAVQILPPDLARNLDVVECFVFEAQRAARIESPHVVRVLHVGVSPDQLHYVVTERVTGQSLSSRVQHMGPLALEDAVAVVHQTAGALSAAHSLGILHRALSPAKILLCDPGPAIEVKILDFDIANQHEHPVSDRRGMTTKAAASMSPEQILLPDEIDARADVWSLAVAAYYALTGQMPFSGDTYPELFTAIARASFTAPSELRAGISLTLDVFFARAFGAELDERFTTAAELDEAFRSAIKGDALDTPFPLSQRLSTPRFTSDAPMAMDYADDDDEVVVDVRKRARGAWARWVVPAAAVASAVVVAMLFVRYRQEIAASATSGGVTVSMTTAAADAIQAAPPDPIVDPTQDDTAASAPVAPITSRPRQTLSPQGVEPRVLKIDDDPDHRPKSAPPSDNPYDEGQPEPAAPKPAEPKPAEPKPAPLDDPGF